ncbi:MAG: DUF349 domain-containing protein [Kofleriaceae bacterium]
MGIADFFRPKYRHSDVRVRAEAVRALTADDAAILVQVARSDRDIGVRRLAMERIEEAAVLADLYEAESERSLKVFAGERAAQLWQSSACDDEPDEAGNALTGIIKLGDQHALVDVVVMAELPAIRKRAFGEIRDPRALAMLAKSDAPQELRTAAVARIDDGDVLRALAIDTTQKEVGLAAVEKIDDVDRLENVAQKAKNKAVRQKARKIVGEIEEAERAKKPGTPDEVKRKRAERSQLVREVEALADTFDFAKAADTIRTAEAAWAALGTEEAAPDDRFTRAVERFWKRKEIHDQTSRGADELRAVEREAQAARDRAAAERAAAERAAERDKVKATAEPASPAPEDPEAQQRRAEDDARREAQAAAQSAERAARTKEDAERGAAIGTSLAAMCDDMEQLAAVDKADGRAIDRALNQSTKAFEGIGKAPAADRDTLAERYRVVRAKLVTKQGELREAEDWQRWANVPKAEALIETAKQMAEAPSTADLGNRLRQLQALWKEVGPMPQRRSKELWDTFKLRCDEVYEKVRGQRAVDSEKFDAVTKVKEALISEAETLAESTDWAATAEKLKALQAQWKLSGHLPRKQGDELWKRFRAACDKFFERRKPQLDARHDEEVANLQHKQQLIARAKAITDGAPGTAGWGKAIGEIKDLQQQWKEIGYVPRRDADAVWAAFRAACDGLFTKRDQARDSEANAHRAEIDALKTELDGVMTGDVEVVPRAIAVRSKARELGVLAPEIEAMVRHVVQTHGEAVKGTELDPSQARAKREKLIARAEELLPKQTQASTAPVDVAAQLKQAMRNNAFGDLRFSGRDPVEVADELRASWREVGPAFDDEDRAQTERFEAVLARVLESTRARATSEDSPPERTEARHDGRNEGGRDSRRRRRDRPSAELPLSNDLPMVQRPTIPTMPTIPPPVVQGDLTTVPDAAASAMSVIAPRDEVTASGAPAIAIANHDAITQPVALPPELPVAAGPGEAQPPADASPVGRELAALLPVRPSQGTLPPPPMPMDDIDTGWDLGEEDPSASETPSSLEMASDGGPESDGGDSVD